jgi:hypothetical protein
MSLSKTTSSSAAPPARPTASFLKATLHLTAAPTQPSSRRFNSGYFTAASSSTEDVVVVDNLGDVKTFQVNDTTPTLETFNWAGVTFVNISPESPPFEPVVFDNLSVTPSVPEPSTWAMMALGFGFLGLVGYRKTRSDNALA